MHGSLNDDDVLPKQNNTSQFAYPVSYSHVETVKTSRVPKKAQANYLIASYSFSNGTIRGHNNIFLQPATRTDIYKYSFFPTVVKLWNT